MSDHLDEAMQTNDQVSGPDGFRYIEDYLSLDGISRRIFSIGIVRLDVLLDLRVLLRRERASKLVEY